MKKMTLLAKNNLEFESVWISLAANANESSFFDSLLIDSHMGIILYSEFWIVARYFK